MYRNITSAVYDETSPDWVPSVKMVKFLICQGMNGLKRIGRGEE